MRDGIIPVTLGGFGRTIALAAVSLPFLIGWPGLAQAAGEGAPHFDVAELGLIWGVPFLGILLSIAVFPLVAPVLLASQFRKDLAFLGSLDGGALCHRLRLWHHPLR